MSEFTRKYIMISASILLIIFDFIMCYFWGFNIISIILTYMIGIANGMVILGGANYE